MHEVALFWFGPITLFGSLPRNAHVQEWRFPASGLCAGRTGGLLVSDLDRRLVGGFGSPSSFWLFIMQRRLCVAIASHQKPKLSKTSQEQSN